MTAGITGHRELENIDWIKTIMLEVINEKVVTYGFTCLATGADEIFAEILRQKRINYTAVIPCHKYETTFKPSELSNFHISKNIALNLIELNYERPSEKAFNEAGKTVVDNSEMIIAVWDGEEAIGLGGTADIVEYAKSKKKYIIHLNPINKTKITFNHG
jgi:hypothetical protein